MPTNAINDTGVKYLYDKLHGEIEPVAEAVSDSEVTIEGNPLNFNTLSAQNAKSTILSLEPIQDLHGYDKPWVGGAGKNKFNKDDSYNATNYRISTSTGNIYPATGYTASNYIEIKQNTSYVLQTSANFQSYFAWYDDNRSYLGGSGWTSGTAKTPPENAKYVRFDCQTSDIDTVMFEEGSSPTSYAPYENLCPISGRTEIGILGCGKNLLPNVFLAETAIGNDGLPYSNSGAVISSKVKVTPNSTYYLSAIKSATVYYHKYDKDDNYIGYAQISSGRAITIPSDCEYAIFQWNKLGEGTILPQNAQLELNNQATTYEPYTKSNDLTISLGQTVYGGTLDVENGVLVVDRAGVSISSGIELYGNYGDENAPLFFWDLGSNSIAGYARSDNPQQNKPISSCYVVTTGGSVTSMHDFQFRTNDALNANKFYFRDSRFTTASEFNTWINDNPIDIAYRLFTPITINLTPNVITLLEGINNISINDDGAMITLAYRDGKVATLADLTSAVDNLDSKIEDSKILTDTATGDKYILVVTNGVLSVEQISN